MSTKIESPLVRSVLALDSHLMELERVGERIIEARMKSEFDFEQVRKLMVRFAEYGEGISKEIGELSQHLNEARTRAESVAKAVSDKAELLKERTGAENDKYDQFRLLSEKVRDLNGRIGVLRPSKDANPSPAERLKLTEQLKAFEGEIEKLINEAEDIRRQAHEAKMKDLQSDADSLAQTLQAVQRKLKSLDGGPAVVH